MYQATFHFHGDVNFFLPHHRRDRRFVHRFDWKASLKDTVESLGPPHTEVDLLVMDDVSVTFDAILLPDVHIDVYDRADRADLDHQTKHKLTPPTPTPPRFVLDTHLGRLANYLRMMGFDTLYRNDYSDAELAQVSHREGRILLTRDTGLLKRSIVQHGRYMRATNPREQIVEVLQHYRLKPFVQPFKRCIRCNGLLHPVAREAIIDHIPQHSAQHYTEFRQCDTCGQIYWKGSHFDRMQSLMDDWLARC